MLIPFDILKVAQAATVLLRTEPSGRMSRLRLLKLLYIADRELLKERGRPITGDQAIAMEHGPVLSRTYDLIKGNDVDASLWRDIRPDGARDVMMAEDPGVGLLSRREVGKLQDVAVRFEHENDWAVAEFTHQYSEWKKNAPPPHSAKKIPLDDLLEATDMLVNKGALLEQARAESAADRAFGH